MKFLDKMVFTDLKSTQGFCLLERRHGFHTQYNDGYEDYESREYVEQAVGSGVVWMLQHVPQSLPYTAHLVLVVNDLL